MYRNWTTSCNGSKPGQLVSTDYLGDGKYDCLSREDEAPYNLTRVQNNPIVLEHCVTSIPVTGIPGFKCGTECGEMYYWCRGYSDPCANLGAGITTDSEILCTNHTLWRNITCDTGDISDATGPCTRCSGLNPGQCAFPTTSYSSLGTGSKRKNVI